MDKGERIAVIGQSEPASSSNYTWMEDDDTVACLDGYYTARQLRDIAEVMDETPMSRKIELTSVTDISRIRMAEHLEHLADMLRKGAGLVHGGLYARTTNSLMGDIELSEPAAQGDAVACPHPCHAGDKCFACGRSIGRLEQDHLVDTRDDQKVYVGSECYKKIKTAGEEGWQPPKGGPRLWLCAPPNLAQADGMCNADNPARRCVCREEFGRRVCEPAAQGEVDELFSTFRLAYYGSNKSLSPELESFRRAYRAIAAQSRAVPDGMVLVPREPTDAMCDAGDLPDTATAYDIYKAMLAAAPQPGESA